MTAPARVGVVVAPYGLPLSEGVERARLAEKLGAGSAWVVHQPNQRESSTVLAALATGTHTMTIGTGILPIYTRPPVVMAQTAATLDELSGGRMILGLGVGHRLTCEWMLGVPMGPPVPSMREYLAIVHGLLRDGEVNLTGTWFSGHASYAEPLCSDLPVYVGAYGPGLVRLAGAAADGLMVWMCSPAYLRDRVLPSFREGQARAGRADLDLPVVAMVPACLSADRRRVREQFRRFVTSLMLAPNYRRLIEAQGLAADSAEGGIGDALLDAVGVIGDAGRIAERVAEYRAAGATEVVVSPMYDAHDDRELFIDTVAAAVG